jgi:hypothetical protein
MDEDPPSALSASPSLSVAATATVNSLRHSGQSHFSTMMQIQGHTVKVNGITYVFDKHQEYDPQKKTKTTSLSSLGHKQEFKPRESKTKKHNYFVEEDINRKRELRRSFLAERLDLLRPFLKPEVESQLQTFLRPCSAGQRKKKPITPQQQQGFP